MTVTRGPLDVRILPPAQRPTHAQRVADLRARRAASEAAASSTAAAMAADVATRERIASKVARGWSRLPPPQNMPPGLVGLCRLQGAARMVTLAIRQSDGAGGIFIGSRFYPSTVSQAVLIARGDMEAPR